MYKPPSSISKTYIDPLLISEAFHYLSLLRQSEAVAASLLLFYNDKIIPNEN